MLRWLRTPLVALAVILLIIVMFQNMSAVVLRFLAWETRASLLVVIFLTAFLGIIIGFFVGRATARGHRDGRERSGDRKPGT